MVFGGFIMIIKLTSTEDKSEQILEVIGMNHEDGSNEIKILNSLGNAGTIVAKNTYDAEECMRCMYEKGKTKIEGVLVWGRT
jgi:hypothetical protein